MNPTEQRLQEIEVSLGGLTASDNHGIATLLCIIRDTDKKEIRDACEKSIQTFINRKKLGEPCNLWLIRDECGIGNPSWTQYYKTKKTVDGD